MRLFRLYQKLPSSWQRIIELVPVHVFRRQYNRELRRAFDAGPPYCPSHRSIIIDITEACDLGCIDCSRSCGNEQAPSDAHMTIAQIERFIYESRQQDRKWEVILIEGGEPTLHPHFHDILAMLAEYVSRDSPRTVLQVNTNGYSEAGRTIMKYIPRGVVSYSSAKTRRIQEDHLLFNLAPVDLGRDFDFDFTQGCYLPAFYGLGLNRYGYYPHPNCGSIDRVFGFDIGRKSLPLPGDNLDEQFPQLCRYCGIFLYFNRKAASLEPWKKLAVDKSGSWRKLVGMKSESWQRAYLEFKSAKSKLTEYGTTW